MKLLSILFLVITSSNLFGQFYRVNPEEYFDRFYYSENEVCYSYTDYDFSFQMNDYNIEEEILMINLIFTRENSYRVFKDDIGLFIPYENNKYDRYSNHLLDSLGKEEYYSLGLKSLPIPADNIDTIYLVRNQEGGKLVERKSKGPGTQITCIIRTPIEIIKLYILDQSKKDYLKYKDYTFDIEVEFKELDYISKKDPIVEVVCPEKINSILIHEINKSLIKKGYLNDKRREVYTGDIKEAIREFQNDNLLITGVIDQKTLALLGVNIR